MKEADWKYEKKKKKSSGSKKTKKRCYQENESKLKGDFFSEEDVLKIVTFDPRLECQGQVRHVKIRVFQEERTARTKTLS